MILRPGESMAFPLTETRHYVSTMKDIPNFECYALVRFTQQPVEGDQRSVDAPGHGYPAHVETRVEVYEVFADEMIFKEKLIEVTRGNPEGVFRGFKFTPYEVRTTVTAVAGPTLRTRDDLQPGMSPAGPCGSRTDVR